MGARGEVVRSVVPWSTLPDAKAWLLGYVRTDVPGYREMVWGGNLYTLASSTGYRYDALVTALDTATAGTGETFTDWVATANPGRTDHGSASEVVDSWPDRLGWVLGMSDGVSGDTQVIPPAGVPLLGATWETVTSEVERRQIVDRHRRNQGFVWGAADLFRCSLTMHRWALEALQTGWCLRGRVTLGGATKLSTPIGLSDPDGAITGYVLGVDGIEWLDQTQTHARVAMSIATDGS